MALIMGEELGSNPGDTTHWLQALYTWRLYLSIYSQGSNEVHS